MLRGERERTWAGDGGIFNGFSPEALNESVCAGAMELGSGSYSLGNLKFEMSILCEGVPRKNDPALLYIPERRRLNRPAVLRVLDSDSDSEHWLYSVCVLSYRCTK